MDILVSTLQQGITPAIIVAIYLIITKILDNKKDANTIKISSELTKSITSIGSFLEDITKNIVDKDKEKCKIAINDTLYASAMRLCNFVSSTIVNNHVEDNKINIMSNIHNIVNAEFYSTYATFYLYKINNVRASEHLNKEWINEIEKDIIDIVYNNTMSKENKIVSFSNNITFKFQSYITYITNHTIK